MGGRSLGPGNPEYATAALAAACGESSGQLACRMRVARVRMHGGEKARLCLHSGDPGADGGIFVEREARLGRAAAVGEQRDVGDGVTLAGDEVALRQLALQDLQRALRRVA